MFDLTGKKALVTGASGGIGTAIAHALYRQGAELCLTGTREAVLENLKQELTKTNPDGAVIHVRTADLSQSEGVDQLAEAAQESLNGLDILINNAGATRDNLALRMKQEEWDHVINLDLGAVSRLTRAVLKPMVKQRYGRIISIASVVGVTGNPGQMNYAAAKAGLIGMSKSLAAEIANRNITVNCIAPGFIATAMTSDLSEAQQEGLKTRIPMGKIGVPEDVAGACVYLASSEAAYVTGHTLHVNGGMAML